MKRIKKFPNHYLIQEVADVLGVHHDTILKWDKQGFIKSTRDPISRYRLFDKNQIHSLKKQLENSQIPTIEESHE